MKQIALISFFIPVLIAPAQPRTSSIAQQLEKSLSAPRAMQNARFFTQFWRIAGGPGFDTCVSYIKDKLQSFGFRETASNSSINSDDKYQVEEDPLSAAVWLPIDAQLSMEIPEQRVLHSFSSTPLMLCHNSFPQDLTANIVYVAGGGSEEDYEKVDVYAKIALCDAPPSMGFPLATSRGALGVISTYVAPYNHPEQFPDIISEGSIPLDEQRKSFGLKISQHTAQDLKRLLRYTQVTVSVKIQSEFVRSPIKTFVAEIKGKSRPDERVLVVAHLDHYKPGANDNASGSATLLEIVRSISSGINQGSLPRPARTLTFLWVNEIQGSEFWIKRHESELNDIKAVLVMDMVGGDPEKTGGTFRIERMPDPAVLWMRRPDHHSGWGIGTWRKDKLSGHYLNDFLLSLLESQSKRVGWKFDVNPFEGGSDHVPFLTQGIPAILAWHFPDSFYHSSLDGIDKLSQTEMRNTGIAIGTAALSLAYGTQDIAEEILEEVAYSAKRRLENEQANSSIELGDAQVQNKETQDTVKNHQREIIEAWGTWYEEAVESVGLFPVDPNQRFLGEVQKEKDRVRNYCRMALAALGL